MSNQELLNNAIANLSNEEKAAIFPAITRKNFVVRKNWLGRNQVITFVNKKNVQVTYNHDEVLELMLPKLNIMPCSFNGSTLPLIAASVKTLVVSWKEAAEIKDSV